MIDSGALAVWAHYLGSGGERRKQHGGDLGTVYFCECPYEQRGEFRQGKTFMPEKPCDREPSQQWVTPNARTTCKAKGCQLCNNCNILVTTWPITLKLRTHVGTPGNVYLCVTVGVRLHVRTSKATIVPDLENGWTDRAQTWYIY